MSENITTPIQARNKRVNETVYVEVTTLRDKLNKLLALESTNASVESKTKNKRLLKCGLWLARLCQQSTHLSHRIKYSYLTQEYTTANEALYGLVSTEIKHETNLAKKENYNPKLLHFICKGMTIVNTWFSNTERASI